MLIQPAGTVLNGRTVRRLTLTADSMDQNRRVAEEELLQLLEDELGTTGGMGVVLTWIRRNRRERKERQDREAMFEIRG